MNPRLLSPRFLLTAIAPLIAAAAFAVPYACPDHDGSSALAAAGHGMTPSEHAAMTAEAPARARAATVVARRDPAELHTSHGLVARDPGSDPARNAARAHAPDSESFHVGTRQRPLVAEGPAGPLWTPSQPSAPSTSMHRPMHGVAGAPALMPADAASDILAERAALTTAQATKRLSKKCQKLVKVKRTRKLSRADKKRRTKCLAQRRGLIEASKVAPPAPTDPTTGVAAPERAIQGPALATPTPTSTPTPGPGQAPTPTPTPLPSGIDPSTVPCALGVTALDVDPLKPFKMTRGVACIDEHGELAIEMVNSDRQMHNLGIRTPNQPDTLVPLLISVPMGERDSVTAKLAPGTYEIVCMVPGHGNMTVTLTVVSKADFIAQGYAG